MIVINFSKHFTDSFYPRLSEWHPAFLLLMLGYISMINPAIMTPDKPGFRLMLAMADQQTWAIALIVCGLLRFVILFINGAWRRSPHLRALSAALSCFIWTQMMVSFIITMGWGFCFATMMLVTDFFNIVRTTKDARIVDDAYKGGAGGIE